MTSVVGAAVVIVAMVALYIYRRRLTRYVRQTRRLRALERDQQLGRRRSTSTETELDAPPPAYNDVTTEGVKPSQLPPRYEEVLECVDSEPAAPPPVA